MHPKVTVVLLVALISNAAALNCFLCIGSLTSDCFDAVVPSMVVQDCTAGLENSTMIRLPIPNNNIEQRDYPPDVISCLSVMGHTTGMTLVERACVIFPEGIDVCEYLTEVVDVLGCESCNDRDLCNDTPF